MRLRKTSFELLLIGLAALIFLLAALGLFLLQNPHAPLPWAKTSTFSPVPSATVTQSIAIGTHLPSLTPRTSYTPFATRLTIEAPAPSPSPDSTPTTNATTSTSQTTGPSPTGSTETSTSTFLPGTQPPTATNTITPTPAVSPTLAPGEIGITGLVVLNGAPVPGISVSFRDDQPTRSYITDAQGRYWFTTYAIGVDFLLAFEKRDNPQYTPTTLFASTALLYGYLPSGSSVITLPDLEISLVLNGQSFEPTTPIEGATYNSSIITAANPIQFTWSTYSQAEFYYVELSPSDNDLLLWGSENTTATNVMFNGTLDDGTQIAIGTYYWFIAANRAINDYTLTVYTQPRSLVISP
jgi:cytoskeletal protein RodZ